VSGELDTSWRTRQDRYEAIQPQWRREEMKRQSARGGGRWEMGDGSRGSGKVLAAPHDAKWEKKKPSTALTHSHGSRRV
jgi:hypothetical protein